MTVELTQDHSLRRWLEKLLFAEFEDHYIVELDCFTDVDTQRVKHTTVAVTLVKRLVRGQPTRRPIHYTTKVDGWTDPATVAGKVLTALILMEGGVDTGGEG